MQIAQAKILGLVNDDGVGIGNVEPRFDDVGGYQHVITPVDEIEEDVFELVAFHLAVTYANAHARTQLANHGGHVLDVAHPVVYKKYLSATVYLKIDGILNFFFV